MNRGILASLLALAWFGAGAVGCAAGPGAASADAAPADSSPSAEPVTGNDADATPAVRYLSADDYDDVFDAAVRELRDRGFRIARNDRRFGVITTYPKESPTLMEPWVGDNTADGLALRSTLNHLRRVVEVTFAPADLTGVHDGPDYAVTVTVSLQRLQQPNRYLTHSARGTIAAAYRDTPAHLAQRGIPAVYWEPAGEDPHLASLLLQAIGERGATTQAQRETD
jgi:hypothetical protein